MNQAFLPLWAGVPGPVPMGGFDVVLVTGDAYVDHPSYGAALIGRVLEEAGFSVAVVAQPDWKTTDDFTVFGRPRLFFGITAGNLDSMVANCTVSKQRRRGDDYSPGGRGGRRPDRAVTVYANRVRQVFPGVPIVVGGIEASLRRFAHYDWWDNAVRRSILLDSRADILVYGMGERQIREIARRLDSGGSLTGIRGTAVVTPTLPDDMAVVEIPSFEDVSQSKEKFAQAFAAIYRQQDPFRGAALAQKHGNRFVLQYPPALPLSTRELDDVYELPFLRSWHPAYDGQGGVPGFETVRHSIVTHRGCCGECSFCSLSMHQGRIVQSRSTASIVREASALTRRKDFKGTITDLGGPTANLYGASCRTWEEKGACESRHCLTPQRCPNLKLGYGEAIDLYKKVRAIPGIRHAFIGSGFRHDLLVGTDADAYLREVLKHHVSGRMKVAPEHAVDSVLSAMNKPPFSVYKAFRERFTAMNRELGKDQYLINYFISAHPGATINDALALSLYLKETGIYPEQIQDFMPLPLTASGTAFYTGKDPLRGRALHIPLSPRERAMQRALVQYRSEASRPFVTDALRALKKEDLMPIFRSSRTGKRRGPGGKKNTR